MTFFSLTPRSSEIAWRKKRNFHHLNRAGIAASLGSACGSCSIAQSHVLHGALRLSLPRETTLQRSTRSSPYCQTLWLTCAPTRGSMLNHTSMHRGRENWPHETLESPHLLMRAFRKKDFEEPIAESE